MRSSMTGPSSMAHVVVVAARRWVSGGHINGEVLTSRLDLETYRPPASITTVSGLIRSDKPYL